MILHSARGREKVPRTFPNRCPRNAIHSKHHPTFWSRLKTNQPMYPNSNRSRCASEAISLCHSLLVFSCLHSRGGGLGFLSILLSTFAAHHPSSLTLTTNLRWRRSARWGSGRGALAPAGLLLRVLVAWWAAVLLAEVPPALGHLHAVSSWHFKITDR